MRLAKHFAMLEVAALIAATKIGVLVGLVEWADSDSSGDFWHTGAIGFAITLMIVNVAGALIIITENMEM